MCNPKLYELTVHAPNTQQFPNAFGNLKREVNVNVDPPRQNDNVGAQFNKRKAVKWRVENKEKGKDVMCDDCEALYKLGSHKTDLKYGMSRELNLVSDQNVLNVTDSEPACHPVPLPLLWIIDSCLP